MILFPSTLFLRRTQCALSVSPQLFKIKLYAMRSYSFLFIQLCFLFYSPHFSTSTRADPLFYFFSHSSLFLNFSFLIYILLFFFLLSFLIFPLLSLSLLLLSVNFHFQPQYDPALSWSSSLPSFLHFALRHFYSSSLCFSILSLCSLLYYIAHHLHLSNRSCQRFHYL